MSTERWARRISAEAVLKISSDDYNAMQAAIQDNGCVLQTEEMTGVTYISGTGPVPEIIERLTEEHV